MYPDVYLKVLSDRVIGAITSDLWRLVISGRSRVCVGKDRELGGIKAYEVIVR